MTPELAARLRIHEPEIQSSGLVAVPEPAPLRIPARAEPPELDEACLPALWRRERLHRRLLGVADVAAATVALIAILDLLGHDRTALAALVAPPIVVLIFKIAGLYDRDELRLVHSTLDEAPLLLQL